jgi:hypothetical protein
VPAALLAKPDLLPGAQFYMDAFWDLSGDRQLGAMGGAGRIPFTALDRWAERHGVEGRQFDLLRAVIRRLDDIYLERLAEQIRGSGRPGSKA